MHCTAHRTAADTCKAAKSASFFFSSSPIKSLPSRRDDSLGWIMCCLSQLIGSPTANTTILATSRAARRSMDLFSPCVTCPVHLQSHPSTDERKTTNAIDYIKEYSGLINRSYVCAASRQKREGLLVGCHFVSKL